MRTVGIGEYVITPQSGEILRTCVMGGRVAVLCHCARTGIAGMLHAAHPRSASDPWQADILPGFYADTGVAALIEGLRALCGGSTPDGLTVALVGGIVGSAASKSLSGACDTLSAAARMLERLGLKIGFEALGDGVCRIVTLEAGTGRIRIESAAPAMAA